MWSFRTPSTAGIVVALVLYLFRLLPLLALPQSLTNFFGLTLYNAFPAKVKLKVSPYRLPLDEDIDLFRTLRPAQLTENGGIYYFGLQSCFDKRV